MITIISSESIKVKFEDELRDQLTIGNWLIKKSVPITERQILAALTRIDVVTDTVILFVKLGKRNPSQFTPMCVGSLVIGLVFYQSHEDISNWIDALKKYPSHHFRKAQVFAMMKPFYLKWGTKIYSELKANRFKNTGEIAKHLGDDTSKSELSTFLSEGSSMAIYVGHGRSRGWSGYHGVRWQDIEQFPQKKPIGSMISLSCSSLANDKEFTLPFGLQWIIKGRCCAFIGTWDAVQIAPLAVITNLMLKGLSYSHLTTLHDLIRYIHEEIVKIGDEDVIRNWSNFKLIGNPSQPL